ncbi:hypothetical protein ACFQI7_10830 [Paenibacillus allorhizosphaerae]|uniref:DUF2178 domain-containing protein n=1 Tax=Paenibacillus allorhizosphaerae TaxID=2849866 RepID=A0ABM8VHT2_9BACL|nr:hypothetical protein [Paenibacillus allorhizosphaerae]CAG7642913.1 hypothetical protein PAECIP111802_02921 [Paenibacillus allorhizosphaerae]
MVTDFWAWFGLLGGALMGFLGWWGGRRAIQGKRGLDERYVRVWERARAKSWILTLFGIYALFLALFLGVPLTAAPVLGIMLVVHMAGWALLGTYYLLRS